MVDTLKIADSEVMSSFTTRQTVRPKDRLNDSLLLTLSVKASANGGHNTGEALIDTLNSQLSARWITGE